jgi:PIN domain nuclease of toxin-antitoxin system
VIYLDTHVVVWLYAGEHKCGRRRSSRSSRNLLGLSICDLPFAEVSITSLQQKWTRDPFDRLIVAQALARGARLITKDRFIRHILKTRFGSATKRYGRITI